MENIILYNTEDGKASVKLYAKNNTVWLSQAQMTIFALSYLKYTILQTYLRAILFSFRKDRAGIGCQFLCSNKDVHFAQIVDYVFSSVKEYLRKR